MFRKTTLLAILFMGLISSFSQNDAKAKTLLDDVSIKMNSYKNSYIEFRYSMDNDKENVHQETKGNVSLQGEKYALNFMGTTQIFDGKKIHTIMTEDEEVNISNPDVDEDITPAKLYSFYKKGYTYKMDIIQNVSGRKVQYVKLLPIAANSELKFVLLGIDSKTKNIYKIIQNLKNGTKVSITISKFKTNIEMSSKMFHFNREKFEKDGYIINDL